MSRIVTIGDEAASFTLSLPESGMPRILLFAPGIASIAHEPAGRASRINGMDESVPSAVLLPTGGAGFFGWPAIAGHRDGRDFVALFAGWRSEGDTAKTTLLAEDAVADLSLSIEIAGVAEGVIAISTVLTNAGNTVYTVERCMAASVLAAEGDAEITSLHGMWGREFQIDRRPLGNGVWLQENRRGRTSHDRSPGVFLSVGATTVAVHLGWSGNHVLAIDTLDDGRRLIHAGELFEPGEIRLGPGESYSSPRAFVTVVRGDARRAGERLGRFVARGLVAMPDARPRPVTLNTWEANYFDHREDDLFAQAKVAADLGIERFVLDDGWFGLRDDDTSSLGDWTVDKRKYPDGLGPLVRRVRSLGMEFGIWFEPEMVNSRSTLFADHPDWVLQVAGRPLLTSRNQLVLDLSRPEVADRLFSAIDAVLGAHEISCVKWDMNRDLTFPAGADGCAATARQTRAFYALVDRVRQAHPLVEIESCASGGGRADYGVLARTHRLWTSDCTDALERLQIQRGATLFFPPHILGAHVSASPNHQTGRRHSLSFRALVALAYHFGVELNPLTLTDAERVELRQWILTHKRLRPLLHDPDAAFHLDPVDGRYVWGASDACRAAVFVAQGPQMLREQPSPLCPPVAFHGGAPLRVSACHPAAPDFIRVSNAQRSLLDGETTFTAEDIREVGLPLPMLRPESGVLLEIEPVGGR